MSGLDNVDGLLLVLFVNVGSYLLEASMPEFSERRDQGLTMDPTPPLKMLAPVTTAECPIMPNLPKAKTLSRTRTTAWVAGILCVACCVVSLAGLAVGSATLAALALYFETAAIAAVVLGIALFIYKLASRRKASSCAINCGCRPTTNKKDEPNI